LVDFRCRLSVLVVFLSFALLLTPYARGDVPVSLAQAQKELRSFFGAQIRAELFSPDPDSDIRIAFKRSPVEMKKKAILLSSIYVEALNSIDSKRFTPAFLDKAKKDALVLLVGERNELLKDEKGVKQRVSEYLSMAAAPLAAEPLSEDKVRKLHENYSALMEVFRNEMRVLLKERTYCVSKGRLPRIGPLVGEIVGLLHNVGPVFEKKQRFLERKYLELSMQDALEISMIHSEGLADAGFRNIYMAQLLAREMLNAKPKSREDILAYTRLIVLNDEGHFVVAHPSAYGVISSYHAVRRYVLADDAKSKKLLDAAKKRRQAASQQVLTQKRRQRILLRPSRPPVALDKD
jgi:hypothetical protein